MMRIFAIAVLTACAASPLPAGSSFRTLTLDERVEAQRAIERVYWNHRIWPADNPGPKPALEDLVTDAELRAKVEEGLRKSNAFAALARKPITAEDLQAEIERMARESKKPEVLIELFHALNDDPFLIAECLARPILADRTLHDQKGDTFEAWWKDASKSAASVVVEPVDASKLHPVTPDVVGCTNDTWQPTKTEGPDGALNAAAVWTGTEMLVFGGGPNGIPGTSTGARYNPATNTWSAMTPVNAPSYRMFHTMVWTGSVAIVWGGQTGAAVTGNTGGRYNPVTDTWQPTSLGANVPVPREKHVAVWTGARMVVWAGFAPGTQNFQSSGGLYDPSTDTWTTLSITNRPSVPSSFAVWTGTRMVVNGGRYDPNADQWFSMSTVNAPSTCNDVRAVWTGSRMALWGGCAGGLYDPVADTWTAMATTGQPAARNGYTAVWTGARMVVWGGVDTSGSVHLNSGGRYDPVANTWQSTAVDANTPSARQRHVAVWSGSQMLVWGGDVQFSARDDGGRYNPSTDSWTTMAKRSTPPSPRLRPAAVWTGAEMLVYGGGTSDVNPAFMNTGGRYDPATDTWTTIPSDKVAGTAVWTGWEMITFGNSEALGGRYRPIQNDWIPLPTAGVHPAGRVNHTAVWTGSFMIIYGGVPSGLGTPGGSRYNPLTNTWSPYSFVNAPSGIGHVAVWAGGRMIVWGGSAPTNTGGRYDPVADTWQPTSTGAGCPTARRLHAAVSIGSEMVVWGGVDSSATNSGARYNPATDTWTPMPASPIPPIYNHTLVWTGSQVVLWGGDMGASGFRNYTGARYDPGTNAWTPTSTGANLPGGRSMHAAVQTDSEMIVWGGEPVTASGARYCTTPCTPQTWYRDQDGDGYGDNNVTQTSCTKPAGYTYLRGDCNDTTPAANPYGTEICDGLDNDCNGFADDPFNLDHDAFATCQGDCNDNDASVFPGATQICDGKNNNCNDPSWPAVPPSEFNSDGDGFRVCNGDCNDNDATVYPGAPQVCDGKNNNCSDPSWPAIPPNELDVDGDTYRACQNDCNDFNPAIHPGAIEACNTLDDDCDGTFDEDAANVIDGDGDGVRSACDNCPALANPGQQDFDVDGWGNACDNCVAVSNPGQQDGDADGLGNVCDNCPTTSNGSQTDFDVDRVGDACDNCFADYNPGQSDFDHDTQGDLCDVNDGLIYLFSTDENYVEWQEETGPTSWNVYEGSLAVLRSSGVYTQAPGSNPLAQKSCGATDPFVSDLEAVPAGAVKFALVTGVTGGVEGSLGTNSGGAPRANTNSCP